MTYTQYKISVSFILLIFLISSNVCRADGNNRYYDPAHGVSYKLPKNGSELVSGYGAQTVELKLKDNSHIFIRWRNTTSGNSSLADVVVNRYSGAKINTVEKNQINGKEVNSVSFEIKAGEQSSSLGIVFLLPLELGSLELICEGNPDAFTEIYFHALQILKSVEEIELLGVSPVTSAITDLPSPQSIETLYKRYAKDPQNRSVASDFLAARALFDYLDGQSGCNGQNNSPNITTQDVLRKKGFFADMALIRLNLEEGDIASAERRLKKTKANSNLFRALKIWSLIAKGDLQGARREAEAFNGSFCGLSGAIAAYQLGLGYVSKEIKTAERYFRIAIEADPSFSPTYFALGKLKLESGGGAVSALGEIKELLARAPDTGEIAELKKKIK